MSEFKSRVLPIRAEPPDSIYFNRPSVEVTGHGDRLIFDAWGGRFFRASEEWVRKGCEKVIKAYNEGSVQNYNDLYAAWNIEQSDFGWSRGWSPTDDWKQDLEFVFTWCGSGTTLYSKFNEQVLMVEPGIDSFPFESYWEV
jgi:hypothetical protein